MVMSAPVRPVRVTPDSRITLARGVSLEGSTLIDRATGGRHELNSTAAEALGYLRRGLTLRQTSAAIAVSSAASNDQVLSDLYDLSSQLDVLDLISVYHPSLRHSLGAARRYFGYLLRPALLFVELQTLLDQDRPRAPSRRYPGTVVGVVSAVLHAMQRLILLGCIAIPAMLLGVILIAGSATNVELSRYVTDLAKPIIVTVIFVAASILHELAHLIILRVKNIPVFYISARSFVAAIKHEVARPLVDAFVAAAGPVAAFAVCMIGVGIESRSHNSLGLGGNTINPLLLIGAMHLLSLGPWSADGQAIYRAISTLRWRG